MRSLLFVPGDSDRKLEKAFASEADIVVLDLEDSVAPANKEAARRNAAKWLGDRPARRGVYVRINDLSTGLTDDDLAAIMPARPHGIMLPKSNGGADVEHLSAKLRVSEARNGPGDGVTRIIALITETPLGPLSAATYGSGLPRLAGLTWGAEDLSAAVGAASARDEAGGYTDLFRFARSITLLAAAHSGVSAIDTVYPDFRDLEGFRAECIAAERDGFTAKLAIHPSQVAVINEVFTPTGEALAAASALVETFRAAGDPGVVALRGKMYDRPHLRLAERLLQRGKIIPEG